MGGACCREQQDRAILDSPLLGFSGGTEPLLPPQPRVAPRQQIRLRSEGGNEPLSLLELSLQCVAQHIESYPRLELPASLAAGLFQHLVSRHWLDLETLVHLQHSSLLAIELPGFAPIAQPWVSAIAAHSELERLDLSSAPLLTDVHLQVLRGALPALREINLSNCQVGNGTLAVLGTMHSLQMLQLEGLTRLTDSGVAQLEQLPSLRWLSLAGCDALTDASVESVSRVSAALRHLSVQRCARLTDASAARLPTMRSLRSLKLGWCPRLSSSALGELSALSGLTALDVSHTALDDMGLVAICKGVRRLRELSLRGCAVSDAAVSRCSMLKQLRTLCLRSCEIGVWHAQPSPCHSHNHSAAALRRRSLPSTTTRALGAAPPCAGDGAASHLGELTKLRDLDLAFTDVSDAGLRALGSLGSLTALSLDSCHVSCEGLECLGHFPQLRTLDLSDVDAPCFSAGVLERLPRLTSLNLFYVSIGDGDVRPPPLVSPRVCPSIIMDESLRRIHRGDG